MRKSIGNSKSPLKTDSESPRAEKQVTHIKGHKKNSDDLNRSRADAEGAKSDEGTEWQPARPDETVADAAERASKCSAKALDHRRRNSIELGASQRADCYTSQIWMSVEVTSLPAKCLRVLPTTCPARKKAKCRLDAECDPVTCHCLVIPRALYREKAEIHPEPDAEWKLRRG